MGVGVGGLPKVEHDLKENRPLTPFPIESKDSKYLTLIAPDVDKSSALNLFMSAVGLTTRPAGESEGAKHGFFSEQQAMKDETQRKETTP